jgi:hypothetical protein
MTDWPTQIAAILILLVPVALAAHRLDRWIENRSRIGKRLRWQPARRARRMDWG